jgi:hypothetical protein
VVSEIAFWGEGATEDAPCLVELGLGVATGALEHACYFSMIQSLNVVKEKDAAISGRHGSHGSINVEAIHYAGLHKIASAETATGALFWNVFHQVIERYKRKGALAQVHQDSVDDQPMEPRGKGGVASKH